MNRKQKLYSILATSIAATAFGTAQAQGVDTAKPTHYTSTSSPVAATANTVESQHLNLRQIYDKLESLGYTHITEIELDDGAYEAHAIDSQRRKTKLYLDPRTGEVIKTKIKYR